MPISVLAGLITTSTQIEYAGPTTYGVIALIATLYLLLPFSDLGLGAAVTSRFAAAHATGDWGNALATRRRAARILAMIATMGCGITIIVSLFGHWSQLLGVGLSQAEELAVGLSLLMFFVSVPLSLGQRILVGLSSTHIVAVVPALTGVLTLSFTFAIALLGMPPASFAVAPALSLLAVNAGTSVAASRLLKAHAAHAATSSSGDLSGSLAMLLITLGIPLGTQAGRLIVAHTSTPEQLARFALATQLFSITWGLVSAVGLALWPLFVHRRSRAGDSDRLLRQALLLFSAIGFIILVAFGLGAPWGAYLISRGEISLDRGLCLAFGFLIMMQAIHLPYGMLLTLPRELGFQAVCVLAMGILAVTLGLAGVRILGVYAVPLASALAVIVAQIGPDLIFSKHLLRRRSYET